MSRETRQRASRTGNGLNQHTIIQEIESLCIPVPIRDIFHFPFDSSTSSELKIHEKPSGRTGKISYFFAYIACKFLIVYIEHYVK